MKKMWIGSLAASALLVGMPAYALSHQDSPAPSVMDTTGSLANTDLRQRLVAELDQLDVQASALKRQIQTVYQTLSQYVAQMVESVKTTMTAGVPSPALAPPQPAPATPEPDTQTDFQTPQEGADTPAPTTPAPTSQESIPAASS